VKGIHTSIVTIFFETKREFAPRQLPSSKVKKKKPHQRREDRLQNKKGIRTPVIAIMSSNFVKNSKPKTIRSKGF